MREREGGRERDGGRGREGWRTAVSLERPTRRNGPAPGQHPAAEAAIPDTSPSLKCRGGRHCRHAGRSGDASGGTGDAYRQREASRGSFENRGPGTRAPPISSFP